MAETSALIQEARAFAAQGRPAKAVAACQTHLAQHPEDTDAWYLLTQQQMRLGALPAAAGSLQRALAIRPELAGEAAFSRTRRTLEAMELHQQSLPLKEAGRVVEARSLLERAIALLPEQAWPLNNLGAFELELGEHERALDLARRAAEHPTEKSPGAHSNLLLTMLYSDRDAPAAILEEHRRWVRQHAPSPPAAGPRIHNPDPERPIRLGYSSPDLRAHPISFFIESVLAHHDRSRFEVTCYADGGPADAVSRRLQAYGHRWVDSSAMGFEQLFARIRADRIDLLFDLAVHSAFNRQRLFAARPAPVQLTWLGYTGTTGSPAMDYRVTDAVVDPPGLTETHYTERLLRLPEIFWCFTPGEGTPLVRPPASDADGRIRFGSAVRLDKVTASCLDLWASLLRAIPQTVLCLAAKPFADADFARDWRQKMVGRGVASDRIELSPGLEYTAYLEFLGSLDVGLDTLPFNGGTTACQTLWMGTPVVALPGSTGRSRVTASILHAIGRESWIADDEADWIALHQRLAANAVERQAARAQLRETIAASSLGNGERFTRQFEQVLRAVFAEHCR